MSYNKYRLSVFYNQMKKQTSSMPGEPFTKKDFAVGCAVIDELFEHINSLELELNRDRSLLDALRQK